MNSKYTLITHIRYEFKSDMGKRIFIIPNIQGIPDVKNVLCLSDTSLIIWDMLANESCICQIVDEICKIYDVTKIDAENDIKDYLKELVEKGYIIATKEK